jgi:Arc/MetJ-type ribon-helix-helix transcriptional regulator
MRKPKPPSSESSGKDTRPPFAKPLQDKISRLSAFDSREHWWNFVDTWEERRGLRRAAYAVVAAIILVGATSLWVYPWWTKRNAFRMARQWLEAGRLQNASEVIQQALVNDPENPEAWHFAAELARRRHNKPGAMGYSRRAAALAPDRPELTVEWAADALLADLPEEAEKALATLGASDLAASSRAQRILGEIARRRFRLTAARDYFAAALRLDGPLAIDEVPLGTILLNSRDSAERLRGLTLLTKHASDLAWGANAMRTLLSDALARDDHPAMIEWAERLRAHPRCTLGDIPNCLLALSRADAYRFATVLDTLEKKHAVNGDQIALLLDWLSQIGRPDEGVRWALTLPATLTKKPPVIVAVAEAMRRTASWSALNNWMGDGDWNNDVEFIRVAYAMLASRQLGDADRTNELWRTLQGAAQNNGVRALFTSNLIYSWGWETESLTLLWSAADQPGVALQALGALARHYQLKRDAAGQYQVFRRLYSLRAQDPNISNNYAFFAALAGTDLNTARKIAEENCATAPANSTYRATYAFVALAQDRARESLALITPVATKWKTSPAVAFAYGLALARNGQQAQARPILETLDPASLTLEEITLIKTSLN